MCYLLEYSMKLIVIIVILVIILIYFCKKCNDIKIYKFNVAKRDGMKVVFIAGVHGNEPAGAYALSELLSEKYFDKYDMRITVIPMANPCGLKMNTRHQPLSGDINRTFGSENGDSKIAKKIINELNDSDLIVDFHEGYDWHIQNDKSIGSTLTPSNTQMANQLTNKVLIKLNNTITDKNKKFIIRENKSCDIKSTLNCHMSTKGKDFILVETSGQKNIQSIDVRKQQVKLVVDTILSNLTSE